MNHNYKHLKFKDGKEYILDLFRVLGVNGKHLEQLQKAGYLQYEECPDKQVDMINAVLNSDSEQIKTIREYLGGR